MALVSIEPQPFEDSQAAQAPGGAQESGQESEAALGSLLEALREIPDPRDPRGVRHPLASLLALCIVAFVCGRQNLKQIRRFGRDHPEVLDALGFPRRRSPSVPTLSRTLRALDLGALQRALARWIGGLADTAWKKRRCAVAAVDGKTSRSAGTHVLSVFLHDVERVIWQAPVDEKKNEVAVLKQDLEALFEAYPFLSLLTGDALYAGEPLCREIIGHGRHYLFQIKGSQPHLYEKLRLVFSPSLSRAPDPKRATGEKKGRLRRRARVVRG